MIMVEFDELLPEVMTHANKCPEPLAIRMLRVAAREFCQESRIWRANDTITVTTPAFQGLTTIEDAAIVAIENARIGERKLEPISLRQLDEKRGDWATDTEMSQARYITQLEPKSITIYPREEGDVLCRLVLKPTRTALTLPDFLVEKYGDQIASGALAQILITPGTEYANPSLGAFHKSEFEAATRQAGREAARGEQGAPLRTTPRYF